MILMKWLREDPSGLTPFQAQVRRARLARLVRELLIEHMQSIYCHEQTALALYQGLAQSATDPTHRNIFSKLAQVEAQRLSRRASMLRRLDVNVPCCDGWLRRLRWRLLIRLGPRLSLAWIKLIKKNDVRRQAELARLLKTLSQSG
ncbi:MAG: hypothetical protein NZ750_04730 [Anaerolineae bacterium]|nr:hypothetical protein [Anaerolineae bacterium]MDW8173720.1 hypothetical protein [Anaerolineae bacterium]